MTPPLSRLMLTGVLVLFGFVSGCAIEPFAGGRLAELPSNPDATFRVSHCEIVDTHKRVVLKKPVWYYVGADGEGPLLFEKAADGQVVAYENRWTDKQGRHALVWIYGGPYGYHILRPWDVSKPAQRIIWRRKDLREQNDLWQPRAKAMPYARCPMEQWKPGARSAAPAARPEPRPRTARPEPPRKTPRKTPPHRKARRP